MQLSSRLPWSQSTNKLSRLLAQKRAEGARLLDLTESNPTRAGFDYPTDLLAGLSDPAALAYRPSEQGSAAARQAVCDYYARRGASIDPEQVLLTASTSEAYSFLFKLLLNPGDRILMPQPSYPLLDYIARLESVELGAYPLEYDGTWHIDFPALERAITPSTRVLVLVNPNNPTGSMVTEAEWERLQELAQNHELAILSDEVFSDYPFAGPDGPFASTPLAARAKAPVFSLNGLSKVAGLPQVKLGWVVAGGPGWKERIAALGLIADTFLSVSTPVQVALPELLRRGESVQQQILARVRENRSHLVSELAGTRITLLTATGGWYAVLRLPHTKSDEDWAIELLENHGVLVQPGFFFDIPAEAHLVISLLASPSTFSEGIQRLVQQAG